jgi:hypothetical protein
MRGSILIGIAAAALIGACKPQMSAPRPTVALVESIAADTSGAGKIVASAGHGGAQGSVALIGEPLDGILLARRFVSTDQVDNISGQAHRDSLPDFAGESFDVILDAYNAPYSHFFVPGPEAASRLDSLRTAAVQNAVFAWDSTCFQNASDLASRLSKSRAKVLVFTSATQAEYGLFDVDTLQQLTGGRSQLVSSVSSLLEEAIAGGAKNLAVWTSREIRPTGVWQAVFKQMSVPGTSITVIAPDQALDVRTEFRDVLRQYRTTGRSLDALLIDSYAIEQPSLQRELAIIRSAGTDEDAALDKMLAPDFRMLDAASTVVRTTYRLLRRENLFTHRIARPYARYYETAESTDGNPVLVEVSASYVQNAYVPDID